MRHRKRKQRNETHIIQVEIDARWGSQKRPASLTAAVSAALALPPQLRSKECGHLFLCDAVGRGRALSVIIWNEKDGRMEGWKQLLQRKWSYTSQSWVESLGSFKEAAKGLSFLPRTNGHVTVIFFPRWEKMNGVMRFMDWHMDAEKVIKINVNVDITDIG